MKEITIEVELTAPPPKSRCHVCNCERPGDELEEALVPNSILGFLEAQPCPSTP